MIRDSSGPPKKRAVVEAPRSPSPVFERRLPARGARDNFDWNFRGEQRERAVRRQLRPIEFEHREPKKRDIFERIRFPSPVFEESSPTREDVLDVNFRGERAEKSCPKCLQHVTHLLTVPKESPEELVGYGVARERGSPPDGAPFAVGTVCATYADSLLISVDAEVDVKTCRGTHIVGTAVGVRTASVPLGATVRMFLVARCAALATRVNRETYRERFNSCGWTAWAIQFVDEPEEEGDQKVIRNPSILPVPVIAVTREVAESGCGRLMCDKILDGFPFSRKLVTEKSGMVYTCTMYLLPHFYELKERKEGMTAWKDDVAEQRYLTSSERTLPPRAVAIMDPRLASEEELKAISSRRNDTTFPAEYSVKSAMIADGALRILLENTLVEDRILETDMCHMPNTTRPETTAWFIVRSEWTAEEEGLHNGNWLLGNVLNVEFKGSSGERKTSIVAKIREVRGGEEVSEVQLQFSEADSPLINAWIRAPFMIRIGPSGGMVNRHAVMAISEGFERVKKTLMYRQYDGSEVAVGGEESAATEGTIVSGCRLDTFQKAAVDRALNTKGISIIVAPPGSGKTLLVSAIVDGFLESGEAERVVIAAETNVAVANALEAVRKADLKGIRLTRVASRSAEQLAAKEELEVFANHQTRDYTKWIKDGRGVERMREPAERLRALTEAVGTAGRARKMVDVMFELREEEKKATAVFMRAYRPNVIGTTDTLLLSNHLGELFEETTHLVVDDASQLVPFRLLAILCAFPRLQKIVLIGDPGQLQPFCPFKRHSQFRKATVESDLKRIYCARPESCSALRVVYRCHPLITKNVLRPACPLLSVSPSEIFRDDDELPEHWKAADGTPVKLFNVVSKPRQTISMQEVNAIAEFVRQALQKGLQLKDFAVLAFHRRQRKLLSKYLPDGALVRTVDNFQGLQAKYVILSFVKNAARMASILDVFSFVGDENLALVAISRCTHGMFVFGNISQLGRTDFYRGLVEWANNNGAVNGGEDSRKRPLEVERTRRSAKRTVDDTWY